MDLDDALELDSAPPSEPLFTFEPVQSFLGALIDVKPVIARGYIEVKFHVYDLDLLKLAGLVEANGRMMEVAVAQKIWQGAEGGGEDGE